MQIDTAPWGPLNLPLGTVAWWRMGPLSLWLARGPGELRVASRVGVDPLDTTHEIELPSACREPPEGHVMARYIVGEGPLTVSPHLADRPVVARPEHPFALPPKASTRVFLGTPVWVRVGYGGPLPLFELPSFRPSDTWFGPSTREGTLCYAGRTNLRRNLSQLVQRPMRAVTAATIHNRSDEPLPLLRLQLPMPRLSIFVGANGALWTESIYLDRSPDTPDDSATVEIAATPPEECAAPRRLSGPRDTGPANLVFRAFNSIFS